jgi:UrcA family protein
MSTSLTARLAVMMSLAGAIVPAAAAVQISDSVATAQIVVSTHGIDLSSSAGQNELRHRLMRASHSVCREVAPTVLDTAYESCVEATFENAQADAARLIASAGGTRLASK